MSRRSPVDLTEEVDRHPAVLAWRSTDPRRPVPERVQVVLDRWRRSVYRLRGVGLDGGDVIVKRSLVHVARLEMTVYEDFLPRLPVAVPHYYGSWLEETRGWILLEDVSGTSYSRRNPDHVRLASRWVATMHASAAGMEASGQLEDSGPGRYLDHLVNGREKIRGALEHSALSKSDIAMLKAVVAQSERIESDWQTVVAMCQGAPDTLVHGDFQAKNILLKDTGDGCRVCPIDWEMAGFGCPAADLTRLDLDVYWSVVCDAWPDFAFDSLHRLAKAGHLFQALAEVHWLSESLKKDSHEGRKKALPRLERLVGRLAETAAIIHQAE